MKVLIAIDSFKGSLTSLQAGQAAAEGIRRVFPDAVCTVRPLADGGEGTVDALTAGLGGEMHTVTVSGPRRQCVEARYGILPGGIAVMEMAQAAGLPLLSPEERDPTLTTTYGVGEMILDAVRKGCRDFILGIGGSATNDGGVGMLCALGWRFTDADGSPISDGAAG
ncbi:MAG: glycerate kinase, partial [Clostridia bacterium]|nr:glycerate kinase [Clostridia bacterium]